MVEELAASLQSSLASDLEEKVQRGPIISAPKGCPVNSWSAHRPRLWTESPVGACRRNWVHEIFLFLKINLKFLRKEILVSDPVSQNTLP